MSSKVQYIGIVVSNILTNVTASDHYGFSSQVNRSDLQFRELILKKVFK